MLYAVVQCKLGGGVWHNDDHDDTLPTMVRFIILTRACNKNMTDWDMRVWSKKQRVISC